MHKHFLLAALKQAQFGRGLCAPNPSVGAVAVCNDQIVAQSWHRGAGTPHAEALILENLPENISEITLYVTLEPCNHWGRTPPCVDAIIRHPKIKKVIYGYRDPNPIIALNNTPAILRSHHIEVIHYPLPEIDAFYQSYDYWIKTNKPWVTVKLAQTFDGIIAGEKGQRLPISNHLCAEFTHIKRLYSDVILSTATTVNQDNPFLTVRLNHKEIAKPLAILDTHLKLNPEASILSHSGIKEECAHPKKDEEQNDASLLLDEIMVSRQSLNQSPFCHIYYNDRYPTVAKRPHRAYHPMPVKKGLLDIEMIIYHLGRLGYHDVWVEAGGNLCYSLHQAKLVNRTYFYIAPQIFGEGGVPAYPKGTLFYRPYQVFWQAMGDNMIACFDWASEV